MLEIKHHILAKLWAKVAYSGTFSGHGVAYAKSKCVSKSFVFHKI